MIHVLPWPEDRVEHVARHNITPEEFEKACFSRALVLRAKAHGKNPAYHVLGRWTLDDICFVLSLHSRMVMAIQSLLAP